MQINPVSQAHSGVQAAIQETQAAARNVAATQAGGAARVSASARIAPSEVSATVLQRATGDGDGRTGAAALNDGDAAAHAAAQQVKMTAGSIDIKV